MKCESCAADVPPGSLACGYCGSSVSGANIPGASDGGSQRTVFERIKRSRAFAGRDTPRRLAALPKVGAFAKIFPFVFLVVFVGIAAFMFVAMLAVSGVMGIGGHGPAGRLGLGIALVPLLMSVVPLGFIVLGVFMFRYLLGKSRRFESAPILARPAIVTAKRIEVSGGGRNSSASTHYYITFEMKDGSRTELSAFGGVLYGRVADGDAGILFSRDVVALDFERVADT